MIDETSPENVGISSKVCNDEPTTNDELGRENFAAAFANLAVECETPLVIGVYGTWGMGKTSFLKMIEEHLDTNRAHPVWFYPWMHQFDENPILAFMHTLRDSLNQTTQNEVKKLLMVAAVALGSKFVQHHTGISFSGIKTIGEQYEKDNFEVQEERTRLQKHFKELVEKAWLGTGKKRLVFFIDDLDRCQSDKALKLLEALKLYLNLNNCVYFLGVDEGNLTERIETEFKQANGAHYLEKMVQLPFHLPPIELDKSMRGYVDSLLPIELDACREMMIHCLGHNPRQVKRFINALILNSILARDIVGTQYNPVVLSFLLLIQLTSRGLYRKILSSYDSVKELVLNKGNMDMTDDGVPINEWSKELVEFYSVYFSDNESLKAALPLVGDLPEKEVFKRYLYLTKAAGISKEPVQLNNLSSVEQILESHLIWLDSKGSKGNKADFERADLRGNNLHGVDLSEANLKQADLRQADLSQANLSNASLELANLRLANFSRANLQGANLTNANLDEADLTEAKLSLGTILDKASLRGVNLSNVRLFSVDLVGADLGNADLSHADLNFAKLSEANLSGAVLDGANMRGTDLRMVKGLTVEQLSTANTLCDAKLASGLKRQLLKTEYAHLLDEPK